MGVRAGSRWPFTTDSKNSSPLNNKIPGYLPFPFFLSYATSLLEANSWAVELVDGIAEGMTQNEFISRIDSFKADIVVLETSTPSIYEDLKTAREIKEQTGSKIVLCGPHASAMYNDVIGNDFVDYILVGEYEYTLLDLVDHLEKEKSLSDLKGLVYREDDHIRVNERRPPIEDLDSLPWPARHFLPMYNYNDSFAGMLTPNVQMMASRGCPYGCTFCLWPKVMYSSRKHRARDPAKVVDEMEWLIEKYKFKSLYFDDDTFNIGKARVIALADEIRNRGIDLPWSIMASAQPMDKEMLEAMKRAGLVSLKYGVESGNQEMLKRINKGLDLTKLRSMVKLTKELGIKVHLTFTFGLPGETWDTVNQTIDFALDLDPDSLQFSICTPFPGTDYFDQADKQGLILTKDWSQYDGGCAPVLRTESMSREELMEAWKKADAVWNKHTFFRGLKKDPVNMLITGISSPTKALNRITNLISR